MPVPLTLIVSLPPTPLTLVVTPFGVLSMLMVALPLLFALNVKLTRPVDSGRDVNNPGDGKRRAGSRWCVEHDVGLVSDVGGLEGRRRCGRCVGELDCVETGDRGNWLP